MQHISGIILITSVILLVERC